MDRVRWRPHHAAVVVAAVDGLLAAPKLVRFWATDPIFSLGFLVVPWAAVWVLTRRVGVPSRLEVRGALFGASLLLAVVAWHYRSVWLSLGAFVVALAAVGAEKGRLREAALPLALAALMVPPPFFDRLLNGAQLSVAGVSAVALGGMGIPVTWEAFLLVTPTYTFVVEPLCSGMSGLLATTALVGIAGVHLGTGRKRLAIALGLGLAFTWLLNLVRVVALVAITHHRGPSLIEGAFHDGVSLAMSLIVTLLVLPFLLGGREAPKAPAEVSA